MSEPNAQAPADAPHGRSSLGRRRLAATVTVIVCLALAVGAGMALQRIRSPKAQALAQAAPAKSVVTAQVSSQVVESTIAGTGTIQVSASETVPVPEASAARTVLSKLPVKVGHAVKNGTVLAEVSGRPVIVLKGAIAAYRDLAYGDTGTDVTQLQKALRGVGYQLTATGKYDQPTREAVAALYKKIGYTAPSATDASTDTGGSGGDTAGTDAGTAGDATATTAQAPAQAAQVKASKKRKKTKPADQPGALFPMAEVAYVPQLPATVMSFGAALGATLDSAPDLATLAQGDLAVKASLDQSVAAQVKTGLPVRLTVDDGSSATGRVSTVGAAQTNTDAGTTSATVWVKPDKPLAASLNGHSVQVTIIAASSGTAALAVPISAIRVDQSGAAYVEKAGAHDQLSRVAVKPGVVGDTLVQVTPAAGASLAAGDRVVVSR